MSSGGWLVVFLVLLFVGLLMKGLTERKDLGAFELPLQVFGWLFIVGGMFGFAISLGITVCHG